MKTHSAMIACLLAGLANASEVIRIQGSDTMLHLNEQWARAYVQFNRGIQIEVSGGGSGLGLSALKQGTATIAAASRQLKPAEVEELTRLDGRPPLRIEVALDAVAVFVHESNQVSWLSVDQLRRIYLGEISNWKEVGGRDMAIARYSRNRDSGTHAFFTEAVLRGAAFHSSTQMLPSTEAVTAAVSRNLRGIGYGGIGYASGVRSLKIIDEDSGEPVEPSNINVITEMYPLSRPLYSMCCQNPFHPKWSHSCAGCSVPKVRKLWRTSITTRCPKAGGKSPSRRTARHRSLAHAKRSAACPYGTGRLPSPDRLKLQPPGEFDPPLRLALDSIRLPFAIRQKRGE